MHIKKITLSPEKFPTREYYPFNLEQFHHQGPITFSSPVTFFIGENGTGKSTLLEAIANRCNIHIWRNNLVTRCVVNPYEEQLYKFISIEWVNGTVPGSFFGSDVFRDFTQYLEEWAEADPRILKYFGGKSLITQSHGQSFMSFFRARYLIKGLYLLDEPETALSPKSQLQLLKIISEESRQGHAQFIIATHSPILMACPDAEIYSFDHTPPYKIGYEDTEHYKIYKSFLKDQKCYL